MTREHRGAAGRPADVAGARALVARYVPRDVSLVADLLAERRREVTRESGADAGAAGRKGGEE